DGRNDYVIQRNTGGGQARFWMRFATGGTDNSIVFGTPTDVIVPGDYDGDGRTDLAVWRASATPGASAFYTLGSTSGANIVPWGANGDYPVANYNVH
ncbi:MAG: hypothetical protein ABIP06_07915, partial [Pyrinomonadaceae bacterium]